MDSKEKSKVLYDLVYKTFETGHFDAFRTSVGAHNQSNEIQFRLLKNIAELKNPNSSYEDIANAILADANIANTLSLITDETLSKIENILGE